MKKLYLIFLLAFLLIGCAVLKTGKEAWLACQHDPVCIQEAKANANKGKEIGQTVGASITVPGGAVAGAILGYGVLFAFSMIKGGLGLIKKKEEVQPIPTP